MTDQDTMRELEQIAPVRTWKHVTHHQFMACFHAMRSAITRSEADKAAATIHLILS